MPKVKVVQNGKTYEIDEALLPEAERQGFHAESEGEHADRTVKSFKEEVYGGAAGKVVSALAGIGRGVTFGGSDALARGLGADQMFQNLEEENPTISTVSNIVGAIAPAVLSGGALTPVGAVSKVSARIAEGGGAGIARHVAAGALEGAAQNTGSYISDVALGDKDLSAEGFVGAMGQGALFGGGAAGALKVGSKALDAARGLFPKSAGRAATAAQAAAAPGEVAADFASTQTLDLAEQPVGRARGLAPEAVGPERASAYYEPDVPAQDFGALQQVAAGPEMPASRMFRGDVTKEAEEAQQEASRVLTDHMGDSEHMLQLARQRIDQARQIEDMRIGRRGGQTDLSRNIDRISEQEAPKRAFGTGIPETSADFEDGMVSTVRAKDLHARGYEEPPGQGKDVVKADKARKAIAEGQRDPVKLTVDSRGRIEVADGRNRLQAAIDANAPIKVKWVHGVDVEPGAGGAIRKGMATPEEGMQRMRDIHADVFGEPPVMDAAGIARGPGGPDLEEQLSQMKSRMDSGESMASMRPVPREVADLEAKRAALEQAHQDVLEMLDKEHMKPYEGARNLDDRIKIAFDSLRKDFPAAEKPIAEKIVAAAEDSGTVAGKLKPIDEQIGDAISRHTKEPEVSLKAAIEKLGPYEKAHADLVSELGPDAPPSAVEHARSYEQSVAEQHAKVAQQTTEGAGQLDNAMAHANASPDKSVAQSKAGRVLGAMKDAATAAHVLHSMGIAGIPDPSTLPVIGPILGMYLKARAMMMVGKRMGLKVPLTAESVIASKSSEHIARVTSAVDKMLEMGVKATAKVAPKVGGTAAVLGHKLFDDGTGHSPAVGDDDLSKRRDELVQAQRPGAVDAMVRDRIRASDPALVDAITAATKRKLDYLYSVVPKPPIAPGLLPGSTASWAPAPGLVESFKRSVAACDDPAGVLEHLASNGQVSFEAAEALRNVYPRLYQAAQRQLLIKAQDATKPLPYAKRVQLSVLFGVPLDGTMAPQYQAALAASYTAPQGKPPGSAPLMSGLAADVTLGARTSTGLDQRGTR